MGSKWPAQLINFDPDNDLAIWNPFGFERTLTTVVISSLTDGAINPDNSGGPRLNSDREMIGIKSAIISPYGGSVGIGFAIDSGSG